MGNNLNQQILDQFVLLRVDWFRNPATGTDVRERVFLAQGGFGCSAETMSSAVIGEFVADGERCRVEGYDLDTRLATLDEVTAALDLREARKVASDERLQSALESLRADA